MGARTRRWVVLAMVAVLPASLTADARQGFPTFSNGTWVGTATYFGELNEATVNALAAADIGFKLVVSGGQVTTGTLTMTGQGSSVETSVGGSAILNVSLTAELSGSADNVAVTGTATFTGTAQAQGFEVPIDFSGPVSGSFQPEWATCTQVGGDFGTQAEEAAAAYGLNVQAEGLFVAKRVADGFEDDPKKYIPPDYTKLVDDMQKAAAGDITAAELKKLVQRIEEVNAEIVGAALCDQVPAGFEEGLVKDDFFYDQFKAIFDKILSAPGKFSVYDLADFLTTAIRVGAVGAAAPDQAYSDATLQKFEQAFVDRLATLNANTPAGADAILAIYVAAKQAGLTDLANAAKAKLQP